MKKIFLLAFSLLTILWASPTFAAAPAAGGFAADLQKQTQAAAGSEGANFGQAQDPRAIASRIVQVFLGTIGILLVIYIIYGGALIFLSAGSEDKINEGKAVIRRAIIGLVVILSAYSITIFVNKVIQNSDPCAEDESGNVDCLIIKEDRTKYNQKYYDNTNPISGFDCKMLPDGTCDLSN